MTGTPWKALSVPEIQDFIHAHHHCDIKELALQKWPHDSWPRALILDQIKSRQKAAHKLPTWHTHSGVIFPPSDIVEQASSQATALFKASLVSGETCIDLTGGCGVDSWALGHKFNTLHCAEHNPVAAELLDHNLTILHPDTAVHIHAMPAEEFLQSAPQADLIYIDPQRRNANKRGLFKFDACSPNIIDLSKEMLQYSNKLLIKASPMVSIDEAVKILPGVKDIYTVEWDNQCKEVLFLIEKNYTNAPSIHAITIDNDGQIITKISSDPKLKNMIQYNTPENFLYEPSPAYQKAGLIEELAHKFDLQQLAPNTNLLTSQNPVANFPGRSFRIEDIVPVHKKHLTISKANLTVRNFPDTVENLRKKLKIKDGGDTYIYACTLESGEKKLILCRKDPVNFL